MKLLRYSERGLINALLYEIAFRGAAEARSLVAELFRLANWPQSAPPPGFFDTCDTALVEQSFSELGEADALFLFASGAAGGSVFFEGKRGRQYSLRKAWKQFIEAFRAGSRPKGLTSNLLCQLYFKQRLVTALSPGSQEDARAGLSFEAPFDLAGRGRKVGENPVVHRAVEVLRSHLGEVYYLMMIPERWTRDLEAWWKAEVAVASPAPAGWDISRWGCLTIPDIVDFCRANGLERTLDVLRHNEGQLYSASPAAGDPDWATHRAARGVSVIYAPAINAKTCLHFFWKREGCALRDYSDPALTKPPRPDRSRRTSEVLPLITRELPLSTGELGKERVAEWRSIVERQNGLWGVGREAPASG